MEHVEGSLYVDRDGQGKACYLFRRLVRVIGNRKKYRDIRRRLGGSLSRAMVEVKALDAECSAIERGEPVRRATLQEFWCWYWDRVKDKPGAKAYIKPNCESLVRFLGESSRVDKISQQDIRRFKANREGEVSPVTVVGNLRDLKRWFKLGVENGFMQVNPVVGVEAPRVPWKEIRLPDDVETGRFLEHLKASRAWLYPLVVALMATGGRLGELLRLSWAKVDWLRGCVTLERTKVKDELMVPMTDQLAGILNGLWLSRGMPADGPVFLDPSGQPVIKDVAYDAFKTSAKRVGIPWLRPKDLRKLAATWSASGTKDLQSAAALLGHADPKTTFKFYRGGDADYRKQAVQAVAARMGAIEGGREELATKLAIHPSDDQGNKAER
jgi:integrase